MSKKRVAFFADILLRDFDGAARTMYHIIDRKPEDIDMLYICGTPPDEGDSEKMEVITTKTFTAPGNETYKISRPGPSKKVIEEALRQFVPDVIHVASPSLLGFYAVHYGREHDIPINTIYHTHFVSYIPYYLRKLPILIKPASAWVRRQYRRFYNSCDRILVPTETILTELITTGIEDHRMHIWARGIDIERFNPSATNKAYLRSITGQDRPSLLFASRLVWEKNVATLIGLHDEIAARGLDYDLIIAGDGVARTDMQKQMPNAFFLGEVSQSDLATLYASVDAFVFTSISETFGNVVTEAMACGCPCIIASEGGTTAHIEDGISGYLVPPTDAGAYLDKAEILINSPDIRRSIVDAGLRYTDGLSWDHLAQTFFINIADIVAQHKQ